MAEKTANLEDVPFLAEEDNLLPEKLRFWYPQARWTRPIRTRLNTLPPWVAYSLVFLITSTAWAALAVFVFLLPQMHKVAAPDFDILEKGHSIFTGHKYIGCGRSVEEARSLGCEYDILANHYLPTLCLDRIGMAQYTDEGTSWIGYVDRNHTTQYSTIKEMGESDLYWTSQRDHIVHCGMLWKRQYRAWAENWRYVDAIIMDEEHTMHCANYLIDMTDWAIIRNQDWRKVPSSVEVGFAGCVDRGSYNQRNAY
jgi:hypothetical protein